MEEMGVPVISSLKQKNEYAIEAWLNSRNKVEVHYPDYTQEIVDNILNKYK
ncbi:hypothetical protein [Sphingobacterium spiritivorum]|uniref:hypothetical protein n=1 Tax=Sphingobacterium spiritivorum TaxID=258 RepID=UPI000305EB8B|nr:hypothetical protein [Sphingobacterium spiritivorum]